MASSRERVRELANNMLEWARLDFEDGVNKLFSTKRQHYVPRLLLRKLSSDRRSVSMVVLRTGHRVEGASIVGQCYGDYFYGDDGTMEKAFAEEETKVGSIIRDTSPSALEKLTRTQLEDLRKFIHWQRARTQGTVDQLNNQIDVVVKSLMREKVARDPAAKFAPEELDSVVVKLTNPQSQALYAASQSLPIIFDLAVKFVLAPSGVEFVISDHPVAACNQFVENDKYLCQRCGWTGLAAKGLQLFLPISPEVTLAVYDDATYQYGSPKSLLCRANVNDVALLNKLQAITAVDALYFAKTFADPLIDKLREERGSHRPVRETDIRFGKLTKRSDGNESQLMAVTGVDIRLGRKFSFVNQLEKKIYRNYLMARIPVRSEELVEFTNGFSKYLDEKVEKARRMREEQK